jgi:hypothetical protein
MKPRPRMFVTFIDRGEEASGPRYVVRRTMPPACPIRFKDETFDDPVLARWCAEQASEILGYPLIFREGRDASATKAHGRPR